MTEKPSIYGSIGAAAGVSHERLAHLEARLWAYAVSIGVPRDDAADVVQEAWSRLVLAQNGQSRPADEKAWLFAVVHRLAVDGARRRSALRRAMARLSSLRESRAAEAAPGEPDDEVWSAVDSLPARQRAAIYLRYRGDLDFTSISTVLGITEGAARSYVTKALDELERRLGPRRR